MKKRLVWLGFSFLMVAAMMLTSCATSKTSTSTQTSTTTTTKTTTTSTKTITTVTTATTTATTTTTATGNWWDSLGTPQYGGTMTLRMNNNPLTFDPYNMASGPSLMSAYMERIYSDDWTLDPSVFAYNIDFRPNDYVRGLLAENYEFTDPTTFVLHLRHGIHWQDLPPANGRELIASDIVNHYDRLYGLDSGMTPSPLFVGVAAWKQLTSVTADGDYTVVFKWKIANPEFVYETLQASGPDHSIECPENVKQWGNLNDWHHAIGTGPFILQDFVSGSGATLVANPNYWKHDERYPQNLLPYINTLKVLIIPDKATTLAGLRSGKIDFVDALTSTDAQAIQKTNPNISQITVPYASTDTIDPRNDVAPFNDKRVRIAMQMALNLPELAATYYNGSCSPDPSTQTSNYMTGWGFPYSDWPQDLKDEYAFNPTQAKALLVAAGVTLPFHTDVVTDAAGDMNLLQIVKSEFADVGINMDIIQKETNDWIAYVRTSRKQDALANRMGAGGLGITYEPLMQFGRFVKASSSDYVMVDDPVYTAFQPKSLVASTLTEVKQLLRDQNEYVARQHYLISLLQPMSYCLTQPWLKGYTGQTRGISGANNPFFMGFYAARLWIDPSLKK